MAEGLVIEQLQLTASPQGHGVGPERSILHDVGLAVAPGEFVALVGASGSGKSMTAKSVLGLLPPGVRIASGRVELDGTDLRSLSESQLNRVRGKRIGMLHQQPRRMFNPRLTVGAHLREVLRLHCGLTGGRATARCVELLAEVGFPDPVHCIDRRAHQLSGGMAQRAMLALALAGDPELLLADEPTSALDKILERQVLDLIDRQRRDRGLGVLYITHDLAAVTAVADRVVVLHEGRVSETGPAAQVLSTPHSVPARRLLAAALPEPAAPHTEEERAPILQLAGVSKRFGSGRRNSRYALADVDLTLGSGSILGVVGQSGSGKSTLARVMVGLEAPTTGSISRGWRVPPGHPDTKAQLVFQDPHDAFDPRLRLEVSMEAPLLGDPARSPGERRELIRAVLADVDLDEQLLSRFPGQCSGGQLQRFVIARALLLDPEILVCDEATSALDSVAQRTILDLLLRLHRERGLSLVLISHDLGVIRYLSHRVLVLFDGRVVESAPTTTFFDSPQHPHSRELVATTTIGPQAAPHFLTELPHRCGSCTNC